MKRNINLQELSRDHHHGLLLGWKIRQGLKLLVDPGTIADYIIYFSKEALFPHFKEEEIHILRFLADDDHYKLRTLKEHQEIADMVEELSSTAELTELLLKIGNTLDDHIRFEEREFFSYLESLLNPEELEEIGAAVSVTHKPFVERYSPEFWKKSN